MSVMAAAPREQMSLFGPRGKGLWDKFMEYHGENPEVYFELRRLALELKAKGVRQYGIAGLFEVLRWHRAMETQDPEGFKLNNNYRAFYARLLMEREPALRGFFETRTQHWQTYEVN